MAKKTQKKPVIAVNDNGPGVAGKPKVAVNSDVSNIFCKVQLNT